MVLLGRDIPECCLLSGISVYTVCRWSVLYDVLIEVQLTFKTIRLCGQLATWYMESGFGKSSMINMCRTSSGHGK